MSSLRRSFVWFKRDLRTEDHEPLVRAAERSEVLGLYVYEPDVYLSPEHNTAHLTFINECLVELRDRLNELGVQLLFRCGSMPDVLDRLWATSRFDELWSHEETGLEATFVRDRRVAAWCRAHGVEWTELPQHGVVRPLRSRDGWADIWRGRMAAAIPAMPRQIRPWSEPAMRDLELGEMQTPSALGLPDTAMTETQRGGAREAHETLGTFLHERGENYQEAMSSPVEGWDACSRLSPHLAYGSISMRTIFQVTRGRVREAKVIVGPTMWRRSLASFEKRLRWHCHFMQKLEDEPGIEHTNISRAYDGLRTEDPRDWSEEERLRFDAWCAGRTGYPMVDACMRCLRKTGWVNFRMRAMLISFASYHLWLHWRPTATHLASQFLDFEPGIHYPQCQMQSGVTGINTVRICSPIKQVKDQDPTGQFIRRWVPELAAVPDEHLPQPELMPALTQRMSNCQIGADYPAPIVDHATAYAQARQRMAEVRKTEHAKQEAERVYERHGSRRRPSRRRTSPKSS